MAIVSCFTEQKINVLIGIYVIVPNFLGSVLKCVLDIIDLRHKFYTLTLRLCRRIIRF